MAALYIIIAVTITGGVTTFLIKLLIRQKEKRERDCDDVISWASELVKYSASADWIDSKFADKSIDFSAQSRIIVETAIYLSKDIGELVEKAYLTIIVIPIMHDKDTSKESMELVSIAESIIKEATAIKNKWSW